MGGRLALVLLVLAVGLGILIYTHDSGRVGSLSSGDFAQLIILGAIGTALASGFLLTRRDFGRMGRSLAVWVLVVLVLVASYQYRYELQDIASRVTAGLIPGSPLSITDAEGRVTVMLEKRSQGHFTAQGSVGGIPVDFLVDTGATTTVLTARDAQRTGFDLAGLSFTVPVSTANGMAKAAPVRGVDVAVGGIERKGLTILVASEGGLDQSLLGMNFIATLSGFDMRGDRLILRD